MTVVKLEITKTHIRFYGTKQLIGTTIPNSSCSVVCAYMSGATPVIKGRTETNRQGHFEFIIHKSNLLPGTYLFRFYGTGIKPHSVTGAKLDDEYLELVQGDLIIDIDDVTTIVNSGINNTISEVVLNGSINNLTLYASEDIDEKADHTTSFAVLSISSIDIVQGEIKAIHVEHKRHDESVWKSAPKFPVSLSGYVSSQEVYIPDIEYEFYSGIFHDFRVQLLDGLERPVSFTDGTVMGDVPQFGKISAGWLEYGNVKFDGVEDLVTYAAATNVRMIGVGPVHDPNITQIGDSVTTIDKRIARLHWDEMVDKSTTADHPHFDGNDYTVITNQWRNIQAYPSYIFVSHSGVSPQYSYPNPTEPYGTWYKLGEPIDNYINVTLPQDKIFGFWIGARIRKKNIDSWIQPYVPDITLYNYPEIPIVYPTISGGYYTPVLPSGITPIPPTTASGILPSGITPPVVVPSGITPPTTGITFYATDYLLVGPDLLTTIPSNGGGSSGGGVNLSINRYTLIAPPDYGATVENITVTPGGNLPIPGGTGFPKYYLMTTASMGNVNLWAVSYTGIITGAEIGQILPTINFYTMVSNLFGTGSQPGIGGNPRLYGVSIVKI